MILYFLDGLLNLGLPVAAFRSLAVRAGCSAVLAFAVALILGKPLLRFLRRQQYIEDETSTDSPRLNEINATKGPVPTMGGLMIVGAILFAGLIFGDLANKYVQIGLLSTFGYGLIGFIDDWVKLTHPTRKGLQAASKYLLQFLVAVSLSFVVTLIFKRTGLPNLLALHVPFTDGVHIDLSMASGFPHMLLVLLVVTGTSNAVNLTDGMDGLAAGSMVVAAVCMAAVTVAVGRAPYLELNLMQVPTAEEMAVFCSAIAGATLGFLWFNAPPALVYMGDTGSLPLGSLLGYVAVVAKQELLLLIIGGLFVLEVLSVIGQVGFFKLSGGRRLLRCAPLHHHFQFGGIPDTRVVVRFWIVSVLFAALGMAALAVAR